MKRRISKASIYDIGRAKILSLCKASGQFLASVKRVLVESALNYIHYTVELIVSLVRPGRKQATATEDFDVHI